MDPHELDDAQLRQELGTVSPEDMARLAGTTPRRPAADARGRIAGRIVSIRGRDVLVDVGAKSEGIVPLDEFEPDAPPQVGQQLSLIHHGFDSDGLMRLSLREARAEADLDSLRVGDVVKARVTGSNIGGLELRVHGLRGFMPMSHVDLVRHEDFGSYIGRWLECEVTEIDRRGKNLVLSRRKVMEREREELRQQLRFQLAEGQVRHGVVRRVAEFGAFVDLGGIDGLLHISDMSYGRVNHPADMLKVGDELDVKVLKVDLVKDRISLGLKQLSTDPWTQVPTRYRAGETIEGRVTRLMDFGAFVELETGVEGLIPISELSWTQRVNHPKDVLNVGDAVRVAVLAVDAEKRKISLSLKALGQDPWTTIGERYAADALVAGLVTRITNFGAFIRLEDGVEGLVHISQLAHQRIRAVGDVVKVGEVVQLKVLSVDPQQRRISLSLKAATAAPEPPPVEAGAQAGQPGAPAGATAGAPGPARPERKRKRELRGGLSF